ncbi:MAG: 2-hydroxyacyl-CoA dehydratase [Thermoleophilia bacterium]|nr:2-hydroxyacyl-CoA dehydratase [Thermoleophilia bacterium]
MREFLELCGFDERASAEQLPRVEKAFAKLGISGQDLERGRSRLDTYFGMELLGVRKIMGVFLKDLVDVTLLRDEGREKIVHSCMAPGMEVLGSAIVDHGGTVGLMNPNFTFLIVLGSVFDRFGQVFEAAERQWLRGGVVSHCGMVKTRVGLLTLGWLPRPDLTVTSGFSCEASPKANELIEELWGIPACYIDACQDRELWEYPDISRATTFAATSMRRVGERILEETGFEITDDMLWEAIEAHARLGRAIGTVNDLIAASDPVPLGSTHLNLLSGLGGIPFGREGLAEAVDALEILYEELLERTRQGVGATPQGAPRVLSVLPCHQCDPRLEHLAEQMGIAIVASDFQGSSEPDGAGSAVVDPSDPYHVLVQHLHGSPANHLGGRSRIIPEMCRRLKVDGVLNHYHVGCRYGVGDAFIIKDVISKELGIPALTFEWENFDPRVYNHEQYKTMLETFKEMMETGRGGA